MHLGKLFVKERSLWSIELHSLWETTWACAYINKVCRYVWLSVKVGCLVLWAFSRHLPWEVTASSAAPAVINQSPILLSYVERFGNVNSWRDMFFKWGFMYIMQWEYLFSHVYSWRYKAAWFKIDKDGMLCNGTNCMPTSQ